MFSRIISIRMLLLSRKRKWQTVFALLLLAGFLYTLILNKHSTEYGTFGPNYLEVNDPQLIKECNCHRSIQIPKGLSLSRPASTNDVLQAIESTHGVSTCSVEATLRGPGQYVVSFSSFGSFPSEYFDGIPPIIEQVRTLYPGWVMRLYHDLDIHEEHHRAWLCHLACTNPHLDLCNIRNLTGLGDISSSYGQIWRMAVMGDPLVKYYMIRDSDAPILQREVDAVQQWLDSKKCFHAMRDHPWHGVPMLGGMWGGCSWWQPHNISKTMMLQLINSTTKKKQDQPRLWKYVWPTAKKSMLMHDSYTCKRYPESIPFPTQRVNGTFVGSRRYRSRYKNDNISRPCPEACRPADHKDWKIC
ncbi:unnamed protein product [Meganyctiphanes norvegica]|uniref:Uncharacterized protein n=1 Tax=Meganyctiphanes norvegica TaxID=48144 RepID=A0AAV2R3T5_MEGNR